ncbi:sensor histidine kinase, partial [Streptomyces sp. H27-D2]|uniref:sensor histidine kinase n=1 Tax=Streptomyces sp. H27-D2 TaxID=3046304 RepID=UPI002DB94636
SDDTADPGHQPGHPGHPGHDDSPRPPPVSLPRSRPRVIVTARVDDGELLLRVADTGAGVDPATAGEVFRRGWSTKTSGGSGASGTHGRGLGLALVHQTARRHGGSVELERAPEGGALFTVRLPLHHRTPEAHAGTAPAHAAPLTPPGAPAPAPAPAPPQGITP